MYAVLKSASGKGIFAVIPIENTVAGAVSENYDLLTEFDNYIVGEETIAVCQCLMAPEKILLL